MKSMENSFEKLMRYYRSIITLDSINSVLYWDMNTYMPAAGVQHRAEQFGFISDQVHQLWSDPSLLALIKTCEQDTSLNEFQERNVAVLRHQLDTKVCLPAELVTELSKKSNQTLEVWKKAKAKASYPLVQDQLGELFQLNERKAQILGDTLGVDDPYEALVVSRDPDFTLSTIDGLFRDVKAFLIPFVKKIASRESVDESFLACVVPRDSQKALVHDLATFLGYDHCSENGVGRIDEVEHPLTIGCGPGDVRVTVKYHDSQVMDGFGAGAHEVGHALHGLQSNVEWKYFPVSRVMYPSLAESQSRLVENHVCGSESFWNHYFPKFKHFTSPSFDDVNLWSFYKAINAVKPSLVRIASDEVTYCLHIIIRYEIERDLFARKITIAELPNVWNERYEQYLGVRPPNDTLGVLQDLHWYSQYWGYFHGYAIGDLIAAQFARKGLGRDIPGWGKNLEGGDFGTTKEWLRTHIHEKGVYYTASELVKHVTGEELSTKPFKDYLVQKYSKIYEF